MEEREPPSFTLDELCNPRHWKSMCPFLTTEGCKEELYSAPGAQVLARLSNRIIQDGYSPLLASDAQWPVGIEGLRRGVETVVGNGWPASFVMLFDEPWILMNSIRAIMHEVTGNAPNMDMLAWMVDAREGQSGFAPHRDRQPDNSRSSFRSDGTPKYSSCWIAISEANPETGCLYVIPRSQDPGYIEGDPEDEAAKDPLQAALSCKEAFQNIRALPCNPGDSVVFSHRIIHWGSAGTPHAPHARISLSFGFSDAEFEMIVYHQRFLPSPELLSLFKAAVDSSAHDLNPSYYQKVLADFVRAAREAHEACPPERPVNQEANGDEHAEDVVDQAMETMLDAELEGFHAFNDDFDELESSRDDEDGEECRELSGDESDPVCENEATADRHLDEHGCSDGLSVGNGTWQVPSKDTDCSGLPGTSFRHDVMPEGSGSRTASHTSHVQKKRKL